MAAAPRGPTLFQLHRVAPDFRIAASEYRWLIDRGYSRDAALKLVGDRRGLPRDDRMILYRGVASSAESAARAAATAGPAEAAELPLLIDGYNQALTVLHYAAGRPVFIGSDGLTRDAGGSHGRIADGAAFARAIDAIARAAASLRCPSALAYLDAPVPRSAAHAELFREALAAAGVPAEARLEKSADAPLKSAEGRVLAATGDSAIADAIASRSGPGSPRLFDLARSALELAYPSLELLDLRRLVGEGADQRGLSGTR